MVFIDLEKAYEKSTEKFHMVGLGEAQSPN